MVLVALVLVCGRVTGAGADPVGLLQPSSVEMTASGGLLGIPGSVGNPSPFGSLPGGVQVRGIAMTRDGAHAWVVGADGGVFALAAKPAIGGMAPSPRFFGSLPGLGIVPRSEIVAIAATADGRGYWLVGSDGGVFAFGDARFFGSRAGLPQAPIVGMAATDDGNGYWLVAADGGVFAFGDARFFGSVPGLGIVPRGQIVGIAASGNGYWLAGSDGGVFTFGNARFLGSNPRDVDPVVAIVAAPVGAGYGLVHLGAEIDGFGSMPSGFICTNVDLLTSPHVIAAATYQTLSRPACNA
jgi:hypothetical protein